MVETHRFLYLTSQIFSLVSCHNRHILTRPDANRLLKARTLSCAVTNRIPSLLILGITIRKLRSGMDRTPSVAYLQIMNAPIKSRLCYSHTVWLHLASRTHSYSLASYRVPCWSGAETPTSEALSVRKLEVRVITMFSIPKMLLTVSA